MRRERFPWVWGRRSPFCRSPGQASRRVDTALRRGGKTHAPLLCSDAPAISLDAIPSPGFLPPGMGTAGMIDDIELARALHVLFGRIASRAGRDRSAAPGNADAPGGVRVADVSLIRAVKPKPPGSAPPLEASAFQASSASPALAGVEPDEAGFETSNPSTRSWSISTLVSV
jgi:hypothetical protein